MPKASKPAKRQKLRLSSETPVSQPSDANKNKNTTPINNSPRSEKMEGTGKVAAEKKVPEDAILVSETELENFFSVAEKNIHKEFTDKYNFDFVNEDPLEGQYEWVKMTPSP